MKELRFHNFNDYRRSVPSRPIGLSLQQFDDHRFDDVVIRRGSVYQSSREVCRGIRKKLIKHGKKEIHLHLCWNHRSGKKMATIDRDADSPIKTAPSETPPTDFPRDDPPVIDSNGTVGGKVKKEEEDVQREKEDVKREKEISDLEELLSKLNPLADEFVPLSLANGPSAVGFLDSNTATFSHQQQHYHAGNGGVPNGLVGRRKNNYSQGRRRMTSRTSMAQREERIRRTVYVSDIDLQVTEEQLAALFVNCGQVNDCRICGDPSSVLRFAFVEFNDEESARIALNLAGTVLGFYPVRVLPSKTAIAPVNPTYLPRSEDEREMCTRTIYCTNIDKKITQGDLKLFFENICGEVYRLRLLGDYQHATRIAFVEFVSAESAIKALNCSGVVLGSQPIRVSPSKTPVRPRLPRQPLN